MSKGLAHAKRKANEKATEKGGSSIKYSVGYENGMKILVESFHIKFYCYTRGSFHQKIPL